MKKISFCYLMSANASAKTRINMHIPFVSNKQYIRYHVNIIPSIRCTTPILVQHTIALGSTNA